MNILELAFEKSPIEARNIFRNISKDDKNILQLSKNYQNYEIENW